MSSAASVSLIQLPPPIINQILDFIDIDSLPQVQLTCKLIRLCCLPKIWKQLNLITLSQTVQFKTKIKLLIDQYCCYCNTLLTPSYECIQSYLTNMSTILRFYNARPMDHISFHSNFIDYMPNLTSVGWLTTNSSNYQLFNLHQFKYLKHIGITGNLSQIETLIQSIGEYDLDLISLSILTNTIQLSPYQLISKTLKLQQLKILIHGELSVDSMDEMNRQLITIDEFEPMVHLKYLEFKVTNIFHNFVEFNQFNDFMLFLPELVLQKFNSAGTIECYKYQTDSWDTPDNFIKPRFPQVTSIKELQLFSIKHHTDLLHFPNLVKLTLTHFQLDQDLLHTLSQLKQLKSLKLSHYGRNRITFESQFAPILSLTHLDMANGNVNLHTLATLNQWMPNLEHFTCNYFNVQQTKIDGSFPSISLIEIKILDSFKYEVKCFQKFVKKCSKLKSIQFEPKAINELSFDKLKTLFEDIQIERKVYSKIGILNSTLPLNIID